MEPPTVDGSCADLLLVAKSAGHSKVSIGYEHDLFELRATTTVAAYRPLKANIMLNYNNNNNNNDTYNALNSPKLQMRGQ